MSGHPRPAKGKKSSARGKKGPTKGTGGHGRKALEGKGPTPRAEDRPYHKAYRAKELATRSAQKRGTQRRSSSRRGSEELVTGRNSVVEALRAGVPVKVLYIALRVEVDDRVKEALKIAAERGIPLLETQKLELDRLTDGAVHQGLVLQIPPYAYGDAIELAEETVKAYTKGHICHAPLLVALDGITDPRNLGAIIRSVSAFAGQGVVVPERRSVGMTAAAWKTSAGAAVRVPVARAGNLNRALEEFKRLGYFVLGLDGNGDIPLPGLPMAAEPLCLVVGSEGKGLSRMVRRNCDAIVSIPINSEMESLNASMAVGISLYEISRQRAHVDR